MNWRKYEWILSTAALFGASLLFFADVGGTFVVDRWDELVYFGQSRINWLNPNWSVIYLLWYRFLALFIKDPLTLHFSNATILSCGLAWTVYFFLIHLRVRPLLALLGGVWTILMLVNTGTTVKVVHFSTIALLAGALFVNSRPISLEKKCLSFGVICLFLVYARMENLPIAIFFLQLFLGFYCMAPYKPDRFLLSHVVLVLAALTLFVLLPPFQRGWSAFVEHYYWVYRPDVYGPPTGPLAELPYIAQSAKSPTELARIMFPEARSTLEAFLVNPIAILMAFKSRISTLIIDFPAYIFGHISLFNLADRLSAFFIFIEAALVSGSLFVLGVVRWKKCRLFFVQNVFFSLLMVALLLKLILLCLVIIPSPRYIMDVLVAFVILFIAIPSHDWNRPIPAWMIAPALAVMLLLFPRTGTFSVLNSPITPTTEANQPLEMSALKHIKEMNRKRYLQNPRYIADMLYFELASETRPNQLNIFNVARERIPRNAEDLSKFFFEERIDIFVLDQKLISALEFNTELRGLEKLLKKFSDPCYEMTFKNSQVSVWYRRAGCERPQ